MLASGLPLTPADSARAVAQVYTISLAATAPLAVAAVAAVLVRRRPAGTRALVWRGAVVALLAVFVGHLLPVHWMAWILPGALASPLVALGRLQVAAARILPVDGVSGAHALRAADGPVITALLSVYLLGVLVAAWPVARGWLGVRGLVARARAPRDARLTALLDEARAALGVRRRVRLLVHADVAVPAACGILRPAILLPPEMEAWAPDELRPVLLHELAHVGAGDVAFGIAARVACALFWWHPAAWLVARALRADCEQACDDRVLAAGVRASTYASVLVRTSDSASRRAAAPWGAPAVALTSRAGLRGRLAAIVDTRRDLRGPSAAAVLLAVVLTSGVALPSSVVELAPTRGVLTRLMADARWDSRAYAVVGLAQRADSVAVARAAAVADPSPRVRAWARLALGARREASAPITSPEH